MCLQIHTLADYEALSLAISIAENLKLQLILVVVAATLVLTLLSTRLENCTSVN